MSNTLKPSGISKDSESNYGASNDDNRGDNKNQNTNLEAEINALDVIKDYRFTWSTLLKYDNNELCLPEVQSTSESRFDNLIDYAFAKKIIADFKQDLLNNNELTELFGLERGTELDSILKNLDQTFDGQYLYQTVQERAARLLYFIIKDHPFIDGNKRIASLLFLIYAKKAGLLLDKISNNAMTTISIMIAQSDPKHMEIMVKLIVNLL